MPEEKPRFFVDQKGQARDGSSEGTRNRDQSQGPDILSDLFGTKSDSAGGPSQGAVGGPEVLSKSPNVPSGRSRFSSTSLVLPAIVLTIFVIYKGGYVRSYPAFLYKTIYSVNSLDSYFETRFWHLHRFWMGIVFLVGLTFLPRITMLWFAVGNPFGWVGSLGWLVGPHVTVAAIATVKYWNTNPELCVIAWIAAYFGTVAETSKIEDIVRKNGEQILAAVVGIGVGLVVVVLAFGILAGVLWLLVILFLGLLARISNTNAILVGTIGILIVGSLLYVLRQVRRLWYGILEVASALLLGGYTIARGVKFEATKAADWLHNPEFLPTILALSSSVYIVVRGLDNIGSENLSLFVRKMKRIVKKNVAPHAGDEVQRDNP